MKIDPAQDGPLKLPLEGPLCFRIHDLSKAAFGNKYSLHLIVVVAQEERVWQDDVARRAGCQPNQAGAILKQLLTAGAVSGPETETGQRRAYYRRCAHWPLWIPCVSWAREILDEPQGDVTQIASRR
jgi:hypothetical protein